MIDDEEVRKLFEGLKKGYALGSDGLTEEILCLSRRVELFGDFNGHLFTASH